MTALVAITTVSREIETTLPGKSPQATVHRRFAELVAASGAVPVLVDPLADPVRLVEKVDAVVINGGGDIDPERYGGRADAHTDWVDAERDEFELALAVAARERGVPLLGVCRGLQIVNVAAGGTLIGHLPDHSELEHSERNRFAETVHEVELRPGSTVSRALGGLGTVAVNSLHHQAVDRVGDGLEVVGRAPDGVVEAIETDDGRTIGVQWHPEFLPREHDAVHGGLFRHLVGSA